MSIHVLFVCLFELMEFGDLMGFWNFLKGTNGRYLLAAYFLYHGSGLLVNAVEKSIKWPEGGEAVARRTLKVCSSLKVLKSF